MAGLRLSGIVKCYGTAAPTLKGIDLEIRDGEFIVLVGPSGCGKSTLLRTIAGLESITEGDLYIGDKKVNKLAPKNRDIAMVFQSYALYPHMTIRRNMSFGLEVRRMPRPEIDKLVDDAAKMLGLEEHLDKLPKMLSGGQRQRVAMGRAIVRRPKVFLFDEPLSNLDASLRTQMRVEIRKLHRTLETTTVYVTHDQVEAMTLADRIAVLNLGILQQVGTPLELFLTPRNKFVASFIGSPSMNFMETTARKGDDGWELVLPDEAGVIALDEKLAEIPGLKDGCKLIFGIRPQDLNLTPQDDAGSIKAKVDIVETLGWESHLHLKVAGEPFLASVEAQAATKLENNEPLELFVPKDAIHLFDPETELALAHGSSLANDAH